MSAGHPRSRAAAWAPGRRACLLGAAAGMLPGTLLVAGAGRAAAQPTPLAATPIARLDLPWWRARHEAVLERIRREPVKLVLLGDSITQDWERPDFQAAWTRFYGGRDAVNMGFTGDTTASLLWRIENGELDGIAPRAAVILIGANNLGRVHWGAEDTVRGIEAVVAATRRRLPRTAILLLSVLPSDRSAWITETTGAINRRLAARFGPGGSGEGVTFIDVTGVFMRDGRLDRDLFLDPQMTPPRPPLHPSPEGQARLAAAIEPALAHALGEPERTAAAR